MRPTLVWIVCLLVCALGFANVPAGNGEERGDGDSLAFEQAGDSKPDFFACAQGATKLLPGRLPARDAASIAFAGFCPPVAEPEARFGVPKERKQARAGSLPLAVTVVEWLV